MRNILWRGLAVALAASVGWMLWHWPAEAEPIEFLLDPPCNAGASVAGDSPGSFVCWEDGRRIEFHEVPLSALRQAQLSKAKARQKESRRPLAEDERCISGQRFYRIKNGWAQVGECQEPVSR